MQLNASSRSCLARETRSVANRTVDRASALPRSRSVVCTASSNHASSSSQDTPQTSQLAMWASLAASVVLTLSTPSISIAAEAYASAPSGYAYDAETELATEEARFDENLLTPEIKDFVALLNKKGMNISQDEIEKARSKVRVR